MFLALRRGFYAMPFQYILDCVRCNDVAEIGERALDSIIAPGDILPRHAQYQIGDLLCYAGSPWTLPRISPFLRDELTVPGKKGIRGDDRLNFIEQPAAKDFGFHGQSYPLLVGEPKSLSFELIFENTVFFDEII